MIRPERERAGEVRTLSATMSVEDIALCVLHDVQTIYTLRFEGNRLSKVVSGLHES